MHLMDNFKFLFKYTQTNYDFTLRILAFEKYQNCAFSAFCRLDSFVKISSKQKLSSFSQKKENKLIYSA